MAPCSTADGIAAESPTKLDSIGLRAARTEHYSLAYCILKRLDANDPARVGISYDLAVAAMETGHFAESTRYFARAEQEAASDSTHDRWSLAAWMDGYGRVAIGDAFLAAGTLDSARTSYERALAIDTAISVGLTGHAVSTSLAAVALAQGRRDEAERLLRRSEDRVRRAPGGSRRLTLGGRASASGGNDWLALRRGVRRPRPGSPPARARMRAMHGETARIDARHAFSQSCGTVVTMSES